VAKNRCGTTIYLGGPFCLHRPKTERLMSHALGEPLVCQQVATGHSMVDSYRYDRLPWWKRCHSAYKLFVIRAKGLFFSASKRCLLSTSSSVELRCLYGTLYSFVSCRFRATSWLFVAMVLSLQCLSLHGNK
jgi:hypothetical protein